MSRDPAATVIPNGTPEGSRAGERRQNDGPSVGPTVSAGRRSLGRPGSLGMTIVGGRRGAADRRLLTPRSLGSLPLPWDDRGGRGGRCGDDVHHHSSITIVQHHQSPPFPLASSNSSISCFSLARL